MEEREGKQSTKDYSCHIMWLLLILRDFAIALGLKATTEERDGSMQPWTFFPHSQKHAKSIG